MLERYCHPGINILRSTEISDKNLAKDIKEILKRIALIIPLRHLLHISSSYEIQDYELVIIKTFDLFA